MGILGDKNGDGAIDFAEFAEIMIPSAPERIAKLKKCFRNRTEIEAAFRRFDTNKDGAISFQEMKNGLSSCAISLTEFVDLLSTSTSSGDGPMAKFLKYCIGQAFRIIDADQDGTISFTELSISLRAAGFSDQEIQTVFALADHDRDGEVSLQELQSSLSHK